MSDESPNADTVRRYFCGCQSGVHEDLVATLAPDVVHYFLAPAFSPIRGADALAKYWIEYKARFAPRWHVDHLIAHGDEVVVEWSCRFTSIRTGERLTTRGTDWYVMRAGRIAEVRAYFIANGSATTELATFPYAERGYLADE
jgi:ketosteroid isomerase-like protein